MNTSRRSTDAQSSMISSEAAAASEAQSCRRPTLSVCTPKRGWSSPFRVIQPVARLIEKALFPGDLRRLEVRRTQRAPARALRSQPDAVLRPGPAGARRPTDLREPREAWQRHVLDVAQ